MVSQNGQSFLETSSIDVPVPGYPTIEAIEYTGELLSDWTNGRITINIFHSIQLDREEVLEQVQVGALEMTRSA